jgi:hypothetical protein
MTSLQAAANLGQLICYKLQPVIDLHPDCDTCIMMIQDALQKVNPTGAGLTKLLGSYRAGYY